MWNIPAKIINPYFDPPLQNRTVTGAEPSNSDFITTEAGDDILTEGGIKLTTET